MGDLEPLGDGLEGILRHLGVPSPVDLGRVTAEWESLVPEPFATRSRPAGLSDGVLILEVADGMVATVLRYRSAELMRALSTQLGPGAVTEVRIRVRSGS